MHVDSHSKRLLIMAAGTGGHIFPGIAIANIMRARGWKIFWLGSMHGMEHSFVHNNKIEMDTIAFQGIRGHGIVHAIRGVWQILISFIRCFLIFSKRRPDIILGTGGYITVPGGFVSKLQGIPLILMNADSTLLLSNKLLAVLATKILLGLPMKSCHMSIPNVQFTGNPIRPELFTVSVPTQRYANRSGVLHILVIGGSLGSKALNECIPQAIAKLPIGQRPIITHQSGKQHIQALRDAYIHARVDAEILDFIDDMSKYYAQADLVLCRAGAIMISELMIVGVASILIPLVVSTTTHQRDNAIWMAKRHAAVYLPQHKMTPDSIALLLQKIDRSMCMRLAEYAYQHGKRNANELIAHALENLVKR